jgi:hypothetical protein
LSLILLFKYALAANPAPTTPSAILPIFVALATFFADSASLV